MLRVVLIDGFESAELARVIEAFVTAKGKPLTVLVLEQGADLSSADSYRSLLRGAGSRATLAGCLLVVRDAERARAARLVEALEVLQVDDEAELPLLVAARVGVSANLEGALSFYLRVRRGLELSSVVNASPERLEFRAVVWRALEGSELAELSGVLVPLPVAGVVTLRADGGALAATSSEPSADDVNEARNFVASLVHHGQVHTHMPGQRARASHEVVTDSQGQRRLRRLRAGSR